MHFKALISVTLLACTLGANAQQAKKPAASASWNNTSLIAVQQKGGDATRPGDVKIEYYGHDAFKFTSPDGLTILIDPWRNDPTGFYGKWFLHDFPAIPVDIVLSTHAHYDHDAVEVPKGLMVLERLVGQFKLGDVDVTGLAEKHQCTGPVHHKWDRASADFNIETCPPNNVEAFDNAIQIVETGGIRIAIWGDNRGVINPELDHYLRNIDVLILPIDDAGTILTHAEVDTIVEKYDPKAVIPAHYLLGGVTTDVSGLKSADEWVNAQEIHHTDVRRLDSAGITLNAAVLKGAHHRIYYFGDHFESK